MLAIHFQDPFPVPASDYPCNAHKLITSGMFLQMAALCTSSRSPLHEMQLPMQPP